MQKQTKQMKDTPTLKSFTCGEQNKKKPKCSLQKES